jgi:hypothetical protein
VRGEYISRRSTGRATHLNRLSYYSGPALFSFAFAPINRALAYDTQTHPGQGPTVASNGAMYYANFGIDTSGVAAGYSIHFDLYSEKVLAGGDIDVCQFAPFSHDANSTTNVPEPATLLLLGSGLVGLAGLGQRRNRQ